MTPAGGGWLGGSSAKFCLRSEQTHATTGRPSLEYQGQSFKPRKVENTSAFRAGQDSPQPSAAAHGLGVPGLARGHGPR